MCVENSCRSQIAQAFAVAKGIEAFSAGSRPSGTVNPKAIAIMQSSHGLDLSSHTSKGLADLPKEIVFDVAVTMGCGDACPRGRARQHIAWDIPDPKAMDDDAFKGVCDLIEEHVNALLAA